VGEPKGEPEVRKTGYGGILAGDFFNQDPGAMDPSWSLSFNAYLAMVKVIGIDRIVFTADYPYGNVKAARQFLDQMPIIPPIKKRSLTSTPSACSRCECWIQRCSRLTGSVSMEHDGRRA
jgi:hypothetical protein